MVAVVAVGMAAFACSDRHSGPAAGAALDVGGAPTSYHIVYRVDDLAGGQAVVSTDELWVHRPFESRLETRDGAPPGGAVRSQTTSAFGSFSSATPGGRPLVTAVTPGIASS